MKKLILGLGLVVGVIFWIVGQEKGVSTVPQLPVQSHAPRSDSQQITPQMNTGVPVSQQNPNDPYLKVIKNNYSLSDEQIARYRNMGMGYPVMIQFSELSTMSGKSVDELIKMKTSPPRGWGKVLHDLKISHSDFQKRVEKKVEGLPVPYPVNGEMK